MKKLIQKLKLTNFLSYGPTSEEVTLEPLNVLIGPNALGKSNFLEAISLLAATPRDLLDPIRKGGGTQEWLWKGTSDFPIAEVDATVSYPAGTNALRHRLRFTTSGQRFELVDEAVENERPAYGEREPYFFYRYQEGHPVINVCSTIETCAGEGQHRGTKRSLRREDVSPEQSVLSQRRDADLYPELTYLANQYGAIKSFREWNLGRHTAPRKPQPSDLPEDFLLEDGSNLGLVLNDLQHRAMTKQLILEKLKFFYEDIIDISTRIHGGTIQVFLHERSLQNPVPATRLSDGTIRYLCLLTILCHPDPPPLVCIEEPELGLHPDILPKIADLLVEASERMQLVVTTHSDILVSALTKVPEAVLVCEREDGCTHLRRLDRRKLESWLENYQLGELWLMGELGGTK